MTTCADYADKLHDAEDALHKLEIGTKVIMLRHGEKVVQYTPANVEHLRAYIASLKTKVDACNGVTTNRRRILRVLPIG